MVTVELIYDLNCPNFRKAREHLLHAFSEMGIQPKWREWNRLSPESPAYTQSYGSPTILIDGVDVVEANSSSAPDSCRLYQDDEGMMIRTPSISSIVSAIKRARSKNSNLFWKRLGALLPVVGTAFLPKLICPACWPAYAGALSALGLGFVNYTPFLLPLTVIFLAAALLTLGYRASRRHGYRPLLLGGGASVLLLTGKFIFGSNLVMYGGLGLLISACVWNSWPLKSKGETCVSCSPKKKGGDWYESEKKS